MSATPTAIVPYTVIPEPCLEFGIARKGNALATDPQRGLSDFGPYSRRLGDRWHPDRVRLIPIADEADFDDVHQMLTRLKSFQRIVAPTPYARVDYPGFKSVFDSHLDILANRTAQAIPTERFALALQSTSAANGYRQVVKACVEAIEGLGDLTENEVVALYLSPSVVDRFRRFRPDFQPLENRQRKKKKDDPRQMLLFEELFASDEEEETLYHDLRRSLKVAAMQRGVALQVLTDNFLVEEESQPWAGKFWNTATSIFCKAGGTPWRVPTDENIAHCGIRFGVSKRTDDQSILVGLAQVFNASGELVAIRAGQAMRSKVKTEAGYYLDRGQATSLMQHVVKDYEFVTGRLPDRLVIHKSSPFKQEELDGVADACAGIPEVDMIYVKANSDVRLLPARGQPADRGSVFPSSENSVVVYSTGFIPAERSWRGKHVPRPMEIVRFRSTRSLLDHARELVRLTKMNWNTTIFAAREPCTLSNATEIIGMMKELGPNDTLKPHIRYYI